MGNCLFYIVVRGGFIDEVDVLVEIGRGSGGMKCEVVFRKSILV